MLEIALDENDEIVPIHVVLENLMDVEKSCYDVDHLRITTSASMLEVYAIIDDLINSVEQIVMQAT